MSSRRPVFCCSTPIFLSVVMWAQAIMTTSDRRIREGTTPDRPESRCPATAASRSSPIKKQSYIVCERRFTVVPDAFSRLIVGSEIEESESAAIEMTCAHSWAVVVNASARNLPDLICSRSATRPSVGQSAGAACSAWPSGNVARCSLRTAAIDMRNCALPGDLRGLDTTRHSLVEIRCRDRAYWARPVSL